MASRSMLLVILATLTVVFVSPYPAIATAAASAPASRGRRSNLILLLLGMPHLMRDASLASRAHTNRHHVPRPQRRARR